MNSSQRRFAQLLVILYQKQSAVLSLVTNQKLVPFYPVDGRGKIDRYISLSYRLQKEISCVIIRMGIEAKPKEVSSPNRHLDREGLIDLSEELGYSQITNLCRAILTYQNNLLDWLNGRLFLPNIMLTNSQL